MKKQAFSILSLVIVVIVQKAVAEYIPPDVLTISDENEQKVNEKIESLGINDEVIECCFSVITTCLMFLNKNTDDLKFQTVVDACNDICQNINKYQTSLNYTEDMIIVKKEDLNKI